MQNLLQFGATGTSLMFKRIFRGYLIVLFVSFTVMALAFSFTVRYYLINDTIRSLQRVAETLSKAETVPGMHGGGGHMRSVSFALANRIAFADFILLHPDRTIISSSDAESHPPGQKIPDTAAFYNLAYGPLQADNIVENDLVAVSYPVVLAGEHSRAALVLYTRLDLLKQLNYSIMAILAMALGAGIIVSLLAGAVVSRVVIEPLQKLKSRAAELAKRQFAGRLTIKTGDEIEELAETFNEMADRLSEYDRIQKEFFQKASHELKTPLMSVQGYAEALKEKVIPESEKEQSLDIIIRESKRMKALVEELLYIAKMETLQERYSFQPLLLKDAANEAVAALQSIANEKGVTIETIISSGQTPVMGDPEKIHRLFLNIIGNALRHAKSKISVQIIGTDVTVEDDGPGFREGEEETVFKPFYRGKEGDTGLGLAISRAIVENHDGRISAKNKPSGGALILIELPPA